MSEEDRCKHGLMAGSCEDCNPAEEVPGERKPRKKRRRRRTKKEIARDKELERRAKKEEEAWLARFKSGRHPQSFIGQITDSGSWYGAVESTAKREPQTREERRQALLESLQPAIRGWARKFKGTDARHWGADGFEWGERIAEFWIKAHGVVSKYLDQEESGTLPGGLRGVEPEKAVGSMFEFASREWYYPKKIDHIVFGGRGLGGEQKALIERVKTGDTEALKGLKKLQREIRKIKREQKRWLIPFDTGWWLDGRDPIVPKNILERAHFENTIIEGAAWQEYITWEQAKLLTKWASYRTLKELAEEMGISRATLYRRIRQAKEAVMPYAKAAIRFGSRRFLKKGWEFDPRKWRQDKAGETDPEFPEPESEDDLDALWYGDVHDDFQGANED